MANSFYNIVSFKNLTYLTNLHSLNIVKNILPKYSQKPYSLFKFSWLVSKKTFALHLFWKPKNSILEILGKQMSLYSCILRKKM